VADFFIDQVVDDFADFADGDDEDGQDDKEEEAGEGADEADGVADVGDMEKVDALDAAIGDFPGVGAGVGVALGEEELALADGFGVDDAVSDVFIFVTGFGEGDDVPDFDSSGVTGFFGDDEGVNGEGGFHTAGFDGENGEGAKVGQIGQQGENSAGGEYEGADGKQGYAQDFEK